MSGLRHCSGAVGRLCFGLVVSLVFVPPALASGWSVAETPRPGGATDLEASLVSDGPVVGALPQGPARLDVRCDAQGFTVAIDWPAPIDRSAGETGVTLRWRLDGAAPASADWLSTPTSLAEVGWRGFAWLKAISGGRELVVEAPDAGGVHSAHFDIEGVAALYERISARDCP